MTGKRVMLRRFQRPESNTYRAANKVVVVTVGCRTEAARGGVSGAKTTHTILDQPGLAGAPADRWAAGKQVVIRLCAESAA